MHVAIDGRTIKQNPSGVGLWNLQLVENLLAHSQIEHISLILNRACTYEFQTNETLQRNVGKRLTLHHVAPAYNFVDMQRFLFEEFTLGAVINTIHPDIYHATDSFGIPRFLSKDIQTVLTIHDLIPLTPYREYLNALQRTLYSLSLTFSLKRANRITVISPRTADDLHMFFPNLPIPNVIPDGIGVAMNPAKSNRKRSYGDFILYFGGFGPRKNAETVVRVFAELLKQNHISHATKLILSGRIKNAKSANGVVLSSVQKLINDLGLTNNVHIMDYMGPQEKVDLITQARMVFFFSLYEGFGLPPCEVLQLGGTPLMSRTGIWYSYPTSSPLIVENPTAVEEIVSKYHYIMNHSAEIEQEKQKLNDFLRPFTWESMTERFFDLYSSLIQ
jgi:glycosyltransferase involved in cell wall biosynthesis